MNWLSSAKEYLTLKTSHDVNVAAKGVPTDINVTVHGLPNLDRLVISVNRSTRNAIIVLMYSVAFFFVCHGISLLVSVCMELVKALYRGLMILEEFREILWINFNRHILLSMFAYVFIIFPFHHRNSPKCKCKLVINTEFVKMTSCVLMCLISCGFLVTYHTIGFVCTCLAYYVMCQISYRQQRYVKR